MNKKRWFALSLVLMLAVVLCVSCAKKEEKEETINMTLVFENKTGEDVEKISVKDKISGKTWEVKDIAADQKSELGIIPVVKESAPNVELTVTLKSGNSFSTLIQDKGDKNVILQAGADGKFEVTITAK